jgi:hypothetical protein
MMGRSQGLMDIFFINASKRQILQAPCWAIFVLIIFSGIADNANAQIVDASQSGFTWISTENVADTTFGSGYTMYCAAWPIFKQYPGPEDFQTGLSSSWLTTQNW